MTVFLSPAAERDLETIGDHIATDNPLRARSFISEIREHCHKIGLAPEAAPLRDDISPSLRMVIHGRYLIFYRQGGSNVRIERILHSARNFSQLLK